MKIKSPRNIIEYGGRMFEEIEWTNTPSMAKLITKKVDAAHVIYHLIHKFKLRVAECGGCCACPHVYKYVRDHGKE